MTAASPKVPKVVIVGAGLSGLVCAQALCRQGLNVQVLEASDRPGGRVRTDEHEGFLLDRGFQVYLSAYPEGRRALDLGALDLRRFESGALVRFQGEFHRLVDPWRKPSRAVSTLFNPVGTLSDKLRLAGVRSQCLRGSSESLLQREQATTRDYLEKAGFSSSLVDRFFQPFLSGIFLESELSTSSRVFEYVFRMFSEGYAVLPARGMEEISRQLADGLPPGALRSGARVDAVDAKEVTLENGETIAADAVVVAVEGLDASRLLNSEPLTWRGVRCLYFAAPQAPVEEPILVLNGDGNGPVNNLCVPSRVSPHYAPAGRELVSVSVLGTEGSDDSVRDEVLAQLEDWYGPSVESWSHLRTYTIPYALPDQDPGTLARISRTTRRDPGLYVCGDHQETGSIQGALVSGRRASQLVLEDLGQHAAS